MTDAERMTATEVILRRTLGCELPEATIDGMAQAIENWVNRLRADVLDLHRKIEHLAGGVEPPYRGR